MTESSADAYARRVKLGSIIANALDVLDDSRYSERAKAIVRNQLVEAQDELRKINGWSDRR